MENLKQMTVFEFFELQIFLRSEYGYELEPASFSEKDDLVAVNYDYVKLFNN